MKNSPLITTSVTMALMISAGIGWADEEALEK